ncbi:aqualysin-1-like [Ptychodera flava]|uniref:aqualysin-1-like n=1 Tax=Ptychodera flava TaxID=63121 RepID=UPI003969C281
MACALAILLTYSSAFPKVKTKTSPQEKTDSKVRVELRWIDEVEYVEEDEVVHPTVLIPPWGLDNVYSSSPLGDGRGVIVFVLDTGIRYTHVDFGQRAKFFCDAFNDGYNGNDCTGHGTHSADTIGGNTVGVAPGVTLYSCRVFDCNDRGRSSGTVGGIRPAVVSMSLGSGFSRVMNNAVNLTDSLTPDTPSSL